MDGVLTKHSDGIHQDNPNSLPPDTPKSKSFPTVTPQILASLPSPDALFDTIQKRVEKEHITRIPSKPPPLFKNSPLVFRHLSRPQAGNFWGFWMCFLLIFLKKIAFYECRMPKISACGGPKWCKMKMSMKNSKIRYFR